MTTARRDHPFFYAVGIALCGLVFTGFARTYYLKVLFGAPSLTVLLHVHGLVMTTWFALYVVQVSLIARRRVPLHRSFGYAGLALAALVAALGVVVSTNLARRELARDPSDVGTLVLYALQLFSMVLPFLVFVTLGVMYRRRADYHKRFMTLAMLQVLGPAITRLPLGRAFEHNVPVTATLSIGCILACVVIDWQRHRRLHPVFGWGFAVPLVCMFGVIAFAQTPIWRTIVISGF
jgi:hypothetical protein